MSPYLEKLVIGTAQFGQYYGIANQTGIVSEFEVEKILDIAKSANVQVLDTAIAYGKSEDVLGRCNVDGFSVITKLPEVPDTQCDIAEWIEGSVKASMEKLKVETLEGLLLHKPEQLLGQSGEEIYEKLCEVKDRGLIKKIGVSVYDPDSAEVFLNKFSFDVVQAPLNIFDRRVLMSDWLSKNVNAGVELHVRSVFLQGLLLLSPHERPQKFDRWRNLWELWDRWITETRKPSLSICLGFALSRPEVDKVIVGVDSSDQLSQILQAIDNSPIEPPDSIQCLEEELINPSCWGDL